MWPYVAIRQYAWWWCIWYMIRVLFRSDKIQRFGKGSSLNLLMFNLSILFFVPETFSAVSCFSPAKPPYHLHPPTSLRPQATRIDCKELGNETLPVFVPEIRKFAQDNLGKVGVWWDCFWINGCFSCNQKSPFLNDHGVGISSWFFRQKALCPTMFLVSFYSISSNRIGVVA